MKLCKVRSYYPGHYGTEICGGTWGMWVDAPDAKTFTRDGRTDLITIHRDGNIWRAAAGATCKWEEIGVINDAQHT